MAVTDPFSIDEVGADFDVSDLTNNPPKILVRSTLGGIYGEYEEKSIISCNYYGYPYQNGGEFQVLLMDNCSTRDGVINCLIFTMSSVSSPTGVSSSFSPGGGPGGGQNL